MNRTAFSNNDAVARYAQVPDDFPRPEIASAVAGFQAKLALVEFNGAFHIQGATPPELFTRWDMCENLAQHLVMKSTESKTGKRVHMSEEEILAQYLERIMNMNTGWGSDAEMTWVIRRAAELLGWQVPTKATTGRQR